MRSIYVETGSRSNRATFYTSRQNTDLYIYRSDLYSEVKRRWWLWMRNSVVGKFLTISEDDFTFRHIYPAHLCESSNGNSSIYHDNNWSLELASQAVTPCLALGHAEEISPTIRSLTLGLQHHTYPSGLTTTSDTIQVHSTSGLIIKKCTHTCKVWSLMKPRL
jgi:hypothetical protein